MASQDRYTGTSEAALEGNGASVVLLATLLCLVSFVPAGLFYLFPVSSQATGTLLVCAVIMCLSLFGVMRQSSVIRARNGALAAAVVATFALPHLVVAAFEVPVDFERSVQSLCLIVIMFIAAAQLAGQWIETSRSLPAAAGIVRAGFVGFAVLGALRIQPPGTSLALSLEKSVFPFPEPSHFAIAFAPLLIQACASSTSWRRLMWIGIGLLMGAGLQNLTLVIATLLAAALTLPLWQIAAGSAAALPALAVVDLSYYTDRLDFTLRSTSYSSLIYRQGWELASDALQRTYGWGIGFQQLGIVPFTSPSADMLHVYLGVDSNLFDGGFTAAKILSEFGAFGILLMIFYLMFVLRCAMNLRSIVINRRSSDLPLKVFCYSVVCGSTIEVFVRGVGYFSGTSLMLVSSFMVLRKYVRIFSRAKPSDRSGPAIMPRQRGYTS